MGLDAPRARLFRGRAENIAAAAAGRFQHPGIKTKDEIMSGKNREEIKDPRSGSRFKSKKFTSVKEYSDTVCLIRVWSA